MMNARSKLRSNIIINNIINCVIIYVLLIIPNLANGASIDLVTERGVSLASKQAAEYGINATLNFFRNNYRLELHRIVRVVLVANKSDYINAMKREFHFTQQDAENKAKNSKGWSFKHTIIQDAGDLSNNRKKLFNICHELVHQFQDQESNRRHNKVRWVSEGSADVIAARILESIKVESLAQYRQWWEQSLRRAHQVPKLTELHDMQDWMAAIDKYGTNITYRTADLAVLELVRHTGFESLFIYFRNMKNGNVDTSFRNAFGISLIDYERR